MKQIVTVVLLALLWATGSYLTLATDLGRDVYCYGKIDSLDPFC